MNSEQYLRKISLVVANAAEATELSSLRVTFQIKQSDFQTPNYSIITVWNPNESTVTKVTQEFTRVVLQAGYRDGAYGMIFDGTIKQFRFGKSSSIDRFLTIYAADGDLGLNNSFINQSLAAGAKPADTEAALKSSFADQGLTKGYVGDFIGGVLPRGKVLFGLARDHARRLAQTNQMTFSVQDGKYQFSPVHGYIPGGPIKITSATGMIGVPEATNDEGVRVRCLLNPDIQVGKLIQIDNKSISRTVVRQQGFPNFTGLTFPPSVTDDGFYRALVVEHEGDTRGDPWYTDLVCLAVDRTVAAADSVQG